MIYDSPPCRLALRNLQKRYGGVHAVTNASLELRAGEVHALMGENGAGKSTVARILAGAVRADAGEIVIEGKVCHIQSPLDAQRLGIGMIHQELDLFECLAVAENIVIANLRFAQKWRVDSPRMAAFCRPFLEQVGLLIDPRMPTYSMSIAQRQLLAIARALSMSARVLIMDEPTSALPEDATERLFGVIRELRARGVTIVYVSHKMDEVFRLSDRVTVLRDGATIGTRETTQTTADEVIRMMVGRTLVQSERRSARPSQQTRLSVTGLTTRKLRQISFELKGGEVLGIAGLVGAGRSSLGAALFGLDRILAGTISLSGAPFAPRSPARALRDGMGFLPEDRKLQGLMMHMSVRENGTLSILSRLARCGVLRHARETEAIRALASKLKLKCSSLEIPVSTLSGGNQQKALLARVLLADPDVLFLDDPTRGIDVAAKEDIYRLIGELTAAGKGVIVVSSELSELLRCADRILVLHQGQVSAVLDAAEATQEVIMAAAIGQIADLKKAS